MMGSSESQPPRGGDRTPLWIGTTALLAVGLFAETLRFDWVYDDQMEIVLNAFIRSLRNLPDIFSTTVWAGSGMETYLYRPLATATYALNFQLSALHPWSFHLFNVFLHALVSILVFRLGKSWGLSTQAAGIGSLLFAAHPIHVEAVAAVFGRKDLMASLFTLAMVLSHRSAAREGGWRMALPVVAYALALLSKEVAMVGLVLVAAQDWVLSEDRRTLLRLPRVPKLYVAYLAILLGYILARNAVTGGMGIPDTFYLDNPLVAAPLGTRLLTALAVLGKGIALQVMPIRLSPDYSFNAIPLVQQPFDPRLLGTLVLLALLGWAVASGRIREPSSRLAIVWYGVAILPTSNLFLNTGTIFGERLLYLPSVAFCLLAGAGGVRLFRLRKLVGLPVSLAVLVAFSAQTLRYSSAWANDLSLFAWAVATTPESTKAHHKLGEELLRAGEYGPALRSLDRSLEIAPDNEFAAQTLWVARRQLAGQFLAPTGEPDSLPPPPGDPDVLYLLGQMSREQGNMPQARLFWERALVLDPAHGPALGDMGVLELSQGDTLAALRLLENAVRNKPSLASAWYGLARIHLARRDTTEAAQALREFLRSAGSHFPEEVRWAQDILAQLESG